MTMVEKAANPSPATVSASFAPSPEKASHRTPHVPPLYIATPGGEMGTTQDHCDDDTVTTGDDGISREAINSLADLWTAVGCRSNWTTPTKVERLRRARDAQQRGLARQFPKPAATSHAGAAHHHDGSLTRERDEFAHDLSAWTV